MSRSAEIETYVQEYEEHRRGLIISVLEFLDTKEALLELEIPIDRHAFIKKWLCDTAGGY